MFLCTLLSTSIVHISLSFLSLSLALTHAHTHTHTLPQFLQQQPPPFSRSLSLFLSHTHTHTLPTASTAHIIIPFLFDSLSLSLSLTHTPCHQHRQLKSSFPWLLQLKISRHNLPSSAAVRPWGKECRLWEYKYDISIHKKKNEECKNVHFLSCSATAH